jgi:hypothetical protein
MHHVLVEAQVPVYGALAGQVIGSVLRTQTLSLIRPNRRFSSTIQIVQVGMVEAGLEP